MDIVISHSSEKPIYCQIYEQIASQILSGGLPSDFCLPSIRTVAPELGISIITVKKAWEELERAGFIYTKSGKGCYVAEHGRDDLTAKKLILAGDKLKNDLDFYRNIGLSTGELIKLIKEIY